MSRRFLAFWVLVAVSSASAESAFQIYGKLRAQAREAYLKKDYATAQPLLEQLYEFSNGSSRAVYNLASVAAAQDDKDRALKWLSVFVEMGQALDLTRDPAFKNLENDARFKELTNRMQQNLRRAQVFVDLLMRRRGGELASAPLTEEWIMALLLLFLNQSDA